MISFSCFPSSYNSQKELWVLISNVTGMKSERYIFSLLANVFVSRGTKLRILS